MQDILRTKHALFQLKKQCHQTVNTLHRRHHFEVQPMVAIFGQPSQCRVVRGNGDDALNNYNMGMLHVHNIFQVLKQFLNF